MNKALGCRESLLCKRRESTRKLQFVFPRAEKALPLPGDRRTSKKATVRSQMSDTNPNNGLMQPTEEVKTQVCTPENLCGLLTLACDFIKKHSSTGN